MKKMTSEIALNLLKKDVIFTNEDFKKNENRWVLHCLYVGIAAKRIASKLNLDEDNAYSLGLIHDIGRKISHQNHVLEGYKYLLEEGYEEEALICLTHSFIDNDINLVAGGVPAKTDKIEFITNLLSLKEVSIYDNIIQLCDLFCLESGFTTLEKRLLDIYIRKGIDINTKDHISAAFNLKQRIENLMSCSLYELFPEINKEDLLNIDEDYNKIMQLINSYEITLKK